MKETAFDLFTSSGILRKQLQEFWGVNLSDYLDKRSNTVVKHKDDTGMVLLVNGDGGASEVHIESDVDRVVGFVTWDDFDEHTIGFRCYQKAHLSLLYRSLIKLARQNPKSIHPEFILY